MRFRRHSDRRPMSQKGSQDAKALGAGTIGAPSTGLSLGGLHACRARLRFTRQLQDIAEASAPARARQEREAGPRQGRPDGCSKELRFFGLDNGVHRTVS